jgi:hypothetical protein
MKLLINYWLNISIQLKKNFTSTKSNWFISIIMLFMTIYSTMWTVKKCSWWKKWNGWMIANITMFSHTTYHNTKAMTSIFNYSWCMMIFILREMNSYKIFFNCIDDNEEITKISVMKPSKQGVGSKTSYTQQKNL